MEPLDLNALAREHVALARAASNGRSSIRLIGDHEATLRSHLIALADGAALQEHESPGDATLTVLEGAVELSTATEAVVVSAGKVVAIPPARHAVKALADSAMVLVVAKAQ